MKYLNTSDGFGFVSTDGLVITHPDSDSFFSTPRSGSRQQVVQHELEVLAPSTQPEKIICVGLNYRDHARETNAEIPDRPVLFGKFANSIIADASVVPIPPEVTRLDYEAELAVVIGAHCRSVSVDDALHHVAGYACANDLSARNLQFESQQWLRGKAIDSFLPLGPALVTADEVGDPQDLRIRCWVNGALRQDSSTSEMIFGVAEIISFASQVCTLRPGDVLITGTPAGVGMGLRPPRWLAAGDEVVVEIERVGRLVSKIGRAEQVVP